MPTLEAPVGPVERAIDALLGQVPDGPEALRRYLADLPPVPSRRRLLAWLREGDPSTVQARLAGQALRILGPGSEHGPLAALLTDTTRPHAVRCAAAEAYLALPPKALEALLPTMDPVAASALAALPLLGLVSGVLENPSAASVLTGLLRSLPSEARPALLRDLDLAATLAGLDAATCYGHALRDQTLAQDDAFRSHALAKLLAAPDEAGVALLTALRASAPKKLRAPFQDALVRLTAALASRGGVAADGNARALAFASNPDGQGALVVFVALRNIDESYTVANVCFRLTEDLRNGFVEARCSRRELDRMMEDLEAEGSILCVPAPPGEVAALVAQAVARTRALRSRPDTATLRAAELIARIPPTALPAPAPPRDVSIERIHALFDRPIHRAWYFDLVDLTRYGDAPPRDSAGLARWFKDALRKFVGTPMQARVVAMARYMSRWAGWRGDADEAGDWTTLADGAERDFATAPLPMVMLDALMHPRGKGVGAPSKGRR
ncbi:MAG: hypothetical protein HY909_21310 [Deltaproteobacteria bacterium]|nr:hypothetical protein [Deltaproteobacteria bacterium]